MFDLKSAFGRVAQLPETNWDALSHLPQRKSEDKLPAESREILRRLRSDLDDARALATIPYEAVKEQSAKVQKIEAGIYRLKRDYPPNRYGSEHALIAAERKALELAKAERARLGAEHARRSDVIAPLAALLTSVDSYLATLPAGVAAAPAIAPKLIKGETPAQAVERLREQIIAAEDDCQSIIDAPIPAADAKLLARRQIEAIAAAGRPNFQRLLDGERFFKFANKTTQILSHKSDGLSASVDGFDAEATFAWLHRDALIARAEAEIDELSEGDVGALDEQTPAKKLAAAKAAKLSLEREEEFFIVAAKQIGVVISRRHDADVRAILQLSDSAPEARDQ